MPCCDAIASAAASGVTSNGVDRSMSRYTPRICRRLTVDGLSITRCVIRMAVDRSVALLLTIRLSASTLSDAGRLRSGQKNTFLNEVPPNPSNNSIRSVSG